MSINILRNVTKDTIKLRLRVARLEYKQSKLKIEIFLYLCYKFGSDLVDSIHHKI